MKFNKLRHYKSFVALSTLLIYIIMSAASMSAASFMPIITNYNSATYNAGLQNWCCTQDINGEIYIANNTGLLRFDGYRWEHFTIPDNQTVRSVLADHSTGRIYVGAYHEFGYFEPDEYGNLIYVSLHNAKKDGIGNPHDYDIWQIVKLNDKIYFQSFSSWFVYDGKSVREYYDKRYLPLYFHHIDNRIFVQMIDGDFYQLINEKLHFIFSREVVGNDHIVAIIPQPKGHMILCTEWNGLFDYDGNTVKRHTTEIDDDLHKMQINRAAFLRSDSTIIIGTILNGVYAISPSGKKLWNYNMSNRLYNNTVLSLFVDRDNNIWSCLDNGIALIHSGSPFSLLRYDLSSGQSLGMVYGIDWIGSTMYIATNQGAYKYDERSGNISLIPGTTGQNWHINHFETDQVFIGNKTPKMLVNGNAVNIPGATNSSGTCMRRCTIHNQDIVLESSYVGLRVYRKTNGKWEMYCEIPNLNIPIREFEVDHSGTIWAAHMSRGIYKIELDKSLSKVAKITEISDIPGGFDGGLMFVMKISGRVMFAHQEQLYTYDDVNNKIITVDYISDAMKRRINSAVSIDDNNCVISSDHDYIIVNISNNTISIKRTVPARFFGTECNESNNNIFVHNNAVYFLLNNAIARYTHHKLPAQNSASHLRIDRVVSSGRDKKEIILPVVSDKKTNAKAVGDITFNMSLPHFDNSIIHFKYHLKGSGIDLESQSQDPWITYGSLGYGHYHFDVVALNANHEPIGSAEYYFTLPRPLHLSYFAIVMYIVMLVSITYLITRYRVARTMQMRKKEFEAEKAKQELKMLEQQRIIDRQQQQLLESELSNKGKEIASLAMDVFTKDRAIETLRELVAKRKPGSNAPQQDFDSLFKQINTNNLQSNEFWDIYQANFDLIHENFFRNLRKKYPNLTPSDLKFCAFLRLNLSTKDIANITNLTIRGVEAARYRLRRKLELPEGTSLVDFLIDFK